ncbi:hypothetical protein [Acinetobacter baumannii]|nr:hypothetical protein [Acinetobacter baumannii]
MFITSFEEQSITYRSCSNKWNHLLTLADLQADSDYAQLQFQQHMPTLADKTNFFFMDVEIYVATLKENFGHTSVLDQVTSVNIFGKNLEDICTLMAQNGYAYDRIEDCWSRELS